jgi:hypothetical protein
LPFPFFAIRLLRYLSVGRFSNSFSLFLCLSVMRRGSGALSPATHAHSTSHSQTYTATFIHPWAPFPTGLEGSLHSRPIRLKQTVSVQVGLPQSARLRRGHRGLGRRGRHALQEVRPEQHESDPGHRPRNLPHLAP